MIFDSFECAVEALALGLLVVSLRLSGALAFSLFACAFQKPRT